MSNLFDLTGKVSIVTGGNSGIGRAIAMGLTEHGSEIVIAARNEKKTEHVVKQVDGGRNAGDMAWPPNPGQRG